MSNVSGSGLKARRNSMDVKQYSIKLQQQNLDAIKSLKASTTAINGTASYHGNPDSPSLSQIDGDRDEQVSHEVRAKLLASKLTARKLKNMVSNNNGSVRDRDRKLTVTFNPTVERDLYKPITDDTIIKYEYKNNDMELLLQEKLHWLTRLHEDNMKVAVLLDDVQRTKQRVTSRLSELTHERNKLRAFLASDGQVHSIDALEQYLMEESEIGPSRRAQCIPRDNHGESEQLLQQLLTLTATLRANQSDVNEYFKELLHKTISSYTSVVTDDSSDPQIEQQHIALYDQSLSSLQAVVDGDPRNIAAATRLATSFAENFIEATAEHTESLLTSGSTRSDKYIARQLDELRRDNQSLRHRLAEEEKRNSQLQAKLASAQVTSSTRTSSRSKLISSSSSSSSHLAASSSAVRVAVMKDANRSSKRSDTTDGDGDDDVNAMRAVVAMAEDIQLPKVVEQFFLDQIETLVTTTIQLHPVGAILDEASTRLLLKLIMRDVTSTARLSFVSIIQHRIGLHEVFGSSAEVFEVFEGIQLEHLSTIDWFSDAVELAVKSVVVNKEVMALTTFYCTYLYASRSDHLPSFTSLNNNNNDATDAAATDAADDDDDAADDDDDDDGSGGIVDVLNPSYTSPQINSQPTKEESNSLVDPNNTTSLSTNYLEIHDSFNLTQQDMNNNNNNNNSSASSRSRSNIYVPPPNSKKMNTASLSPVKRYMMPKQRRA